MAAGVRLDQTLSFHSEAELPGKEDSPSSFLRPKRFFLHSIGVVGITANFVRYDDRAGLALSEK
jgi:hypothetical protein